MHLKFEGKLIHLTIFIVPLLFCVIVVTSLIPDLADINADSHSVFDAPFQSAAVAQPGKPMSVVPQAIVQPDRQWRR